MMILSGGRIRVLVREKKLIEGFVESSLCGAGYDLRAGRFYRTCGSASLSADGRILPEIEEITCESLVLRPGDYILVETEEKVNMPNNLMARILNRSSVFRGGCSLITAVVDPGYYGTLTMGLKNLSDHDFSIGRGARIGQIVFEEVSDGASAYSGRYQGGKVV